MLAGDHLEHAFGAAAYVTPEHVHYFSWFLPHIYLSNAFW